MDAVETPVAARVHAFVREHDLIPDRGGVTCLVSGGADSTCLWHVLGALRYRVSAVHVDHGLRGEESDVDARFCKEALGAEVLHTGAATTESDLRALRYRITEGRGLRATGHTASDQVETVLYRLVSSGSTRGIKAAREDGVVRPLLPLWREETETYCEAHGLAFRRDSSNSETKRGLIREEILPLLRRLHPGAEANLAALANRPAGLPRSLERALVDLLSSTDGTKRANLGAGLAAIREYDVLRLEGRVEFGPWWLETERPGLSVRTRRPGDRLAGRRKKVQDLLVDAKVPKADRETWPLVVRGDEVVSVPGIADAPGWEGAVRAWRPEEMDA